PFQSRAGLFHNVQKSEQGTAVREEVIDHKNMVFSCEKFLCKNDVVDFFVGERLDFCAVHLPVQVDALRFLGEYNRHIEILCCNTGNSDTRRLNGENLSDGAVRKAAFEFLAD